MALDWDEGFSTGIDELDNEHRELFSRFNELIKACDLGNGRHEALRMIDFLNDHMESHFCAEEELQRQYGYPERERHREEHRAFKRDMEQLKHQLAELGPIPRLVATTNQLIAVWLIDHISRQDADFARFLAIARR